MCLAAFTQSLNCLLADLRHSNHKLRYRETSMGDTLGLIGRNRFCPDNWARTESVCRVEFDKINLALRRVPPLRVHNLAACGAVHYRTSKSHSVTTIRFLCLPAPG